MNSINAIFFPLKLNPNEDLKIKLNEFCLKNSIEAGFVISGIGSLKSLRIRLANANDSVKRDEFFEILSLQGTLSTEGLHIHISAADSKGQVIGGHLLDGSLIYTTAELLITNCQGYKFTRGIDSNTGYKELQIYKKS